MISQYITSRLARINEWAFVTRRITGGLADCLVIAHIARDCKCLQNTRVVHHTRRFRVCPCSGRYARANRFVQHVIALENYITPCVWTRNVYRTRSSGLLFCVGNFKKKTTSSPARALEYVVITRAFPSRSGYRLPLTKPIRSRLVDFRTVE